MSGSFPLLGDVGIFMGDAGFGPVTCPPKTEPAGELHSLGKSQERIIKLCARNGREPLDLRILHHGREELRELPHPELGTSLRPPAGSGAGSGSSYACPRAATKHGPRSRRASLSVILMVSPFSLNSSPMCNRSIPVDHAEWVARRFEGTIQAVKRSPLCRVCGAKIRRLPAVFSLGLSERLSPVGL